MIYDTSAVLATMVRNTSNTCVCKILKSHVTIDTDELFRRIEVNDPKGNGVITAYGILGCKGVPRPVRKPKAGRRIKHFANQLTVVFVMSSKLLSESKANVKIFRNGSLQLTGIRNIHQVYIIAGYIQKIMLKADVVVADDLIEDPVDFGVRCCMMNCDFKLPFLVDLHRLHSVLLREGYTSIYDPKQYPCIKVYYYGTVDSKDGKCCCPNGVHVKSKDGTCIRSVASIGKRIGTTGIPSPERALRQTSSLMDIIVRHRPEVEACIPLSPDDVIDEYC